MRSTGLAQTSFIFWQTTWELVTCGPSIAGGKIVTPNLDRLAQEGMRFTDAHSGSAVCTPTRYGILTGRYAWQTRLQSGVLFGYSRPLIESSRITVVSMLKELGYRTGCIGKWHLGLKWTLRHPDNPPSDHPLEQWHNIDYQSADFLRSPAGRV